MDLAWSSRIFYNMQNKIEISWDWAKKKKKRLKEICVQKSLGSKKCCEKSFRWEKTLGKEKCWVKKTLDQKKILYQKIYIGYKKEVDNLSLVYTFPNITFLKS